MKNVAIATIGMSPPVITEFIQYLHEGLGIKISDLTIISTTDPFVKASVKLVTAAIKHKYPQIHTHESQLPFEDMDSWERMLEFMKIGAKIIHDAKIRHKATSTYLCIAGGRKEGSVILSLLAQIIGVNMVAHIVAKDIKAFNIELERIKRYIEELGESNEPDTYYLKYKDLFEPVLFPHPSNYSVINIPIIPYPKKTLQDIMKLLLSKSPIPRGAIELPIDVLIGLSGAKLIKLGSKNIWVLNQGRELALALKDVIF
ncbi:MAG: CRISPR-associated protein Csx14 [Nitrososphaerota archaeon]|nr:CRISPR-associated protein Csx14 [Nitrososphaerales archaeon]MDW8045002.1 CRISPR-associated protein Csx14 [Nitrososphaerota archaeon]